MNLDPILARQVEINAEDIDTLKTRLNELGSQGQEKMDANVTVDSAPSTYTNIVTYEIKQCSAVRLTSVTEFTNIGYSYVHTYRSNAETYTIKSYQQAYAINDSGEIITAYRVASDDGATWGAWTSGLAQNAGSGGNSSIISPDAPGDSEQKNGEYWFEPIESVNIP